MVRVFVIRFSVLEDLCRVLARVVHDRLLASWVVPKELRAIVNKVVDDDPA